MTTRRERKYGVKPRVKILTRAERLAARRRKRKLGPSAKRRAERRQAVTA